MAIRTPLVIVTGQIQQLQAGDSVAMGNWPFRTTAISTSATSADRVIVCTAVPVTITLPTAASVGAGFLLVVKDGTGTARGAAPITITRAGADTIDDATGEEIRAAYGSYSMVSDGVSDWSII